MASKKDPARPPFDPARRLNIYLDSTEDRDRFNQAAAAVGLGRQRGVFLARLLDVYAAADVLLARLDDHQRTGCKCGGHCHDDDLAQLEAAVRPGS